MGSSMLADALTGLSIARDEPVVAIAVVRRTGGYPDATTHAALPPRHPSGAFEPVSLPIRGKAGDYGDVVPDAEDLGAALLVGLANKAGWSDLAEEGFGYKASIPLGDAARGSRRDGQGLPVDAVPRVLGIVAFRTSSWERIVGLGSGGLARQDDVAVVMRGLAGVREAHAAGDREALSRNYHLTRLEVVRSYGRDPTAPNGFRTTRLPPLAAALADREGGRLLAAVAAEGLVAGIGTRALREGPGPEIQATLGAIWDLQAAERGMGLLCRTWQPSYSAGQHDNAYEVAAGAVETLGDALGSAIGRFEEGMYEDGDLPRLEAMLARIDGIRSELGKRLDAAREEWFGEGDDAGPRP